MSTTINPTTQKITLLNRVGPQLAKRLERLHIYTVQDLLFHLPLRYQDRTRVVPISMLRHGMEAAIVGEIIHSRIKFGKRRMLLCTVQDGSGAITLRFFHFNAKQQATLQTGNQLRCFGEARMVSGTLEMVHPEYSSISTQAELPVAEHLTAIYPLTEGVTQYTLRGLIDQVVIDDAHICCELEDYIPPQLLSKLKFPNLAQAIAYVHRPPPDAPINLLNEGEHPAQLRLAFEELLAHHLSLRRLREKHKRHSAPALDINAQSTADFVKALPFTLTKAQHRVIHEIGQDLSCNYPMLRLVQDDVGSGKTVVSAVAALYSIRAGYQVAIMAPTEILVDQHHYSFSQWLNPLGIEVVQLTGKLPRKKRSQVLDQIATGDARVVIGTHALFQDEVVFCELGLVVIDEQHRFGVHQRLALRNKTVNQDQAKPSSNSKAEYYPHQLVMTATPIPRTLAMTAYADLDFSVIDELPPGRQPIETVVLSDHRREEVIDRVYQACRGGRQTYWVCTLIEESEQLQCQAAQDTAQQLGASLKDITIGLIHGRMKPDEKQKIMSDFKAGEMDLLVATTVIEVGVDVANATLMIIENAERLGLSQLHQLRGRVGRGSKQSVCVLMYHPPLSKLASARLEIMRETTDGFELAKRDLELRGPGELLGTRQTGVVQYHIANLQKHQHMLINVRQTAEYLLKNEHMSIVPLINRWIGQRSIYADV